MDAYSSFASVYDTLMYDVDYKKRTAYLRRLFCKHDRMPSLLLDVACGTGGFSNEFASLGTEVIGIDMSEEMLSAARENSATRGTDVLFLCQRAEELDLYGTVDGAVCCLDSINHITDYNKLCQAFGRIALFLEPERLFIFDVNSEYKHREVLGNNSFVIEHGNVFCVWQNSYNEKKRVTDIALDFFVADGDDRYIRSSEDFRERAYTPEELENAITSAGLSVVAKYADMSENAPSAGTERIIYVTRRTGAE